MYRTREVTEKMKNLLIGNWSFEDGKYGKNIVFKPEGKFTLVDERGKSIWGKYNPVQEGTDTKIYLDTNDASIFGPLLIVSVNERELVFRSFNSGNIRLLKKN